MAGPSGKELGVAVFPLVLQEGLDRVRHLEGRSQTEWAKPMPQCLPVASFPGKTPGEKDWMKAQMPEDGAHSNMSCARDDRRAFRRSECETGPEEVSLCRVDSTN